MGRGRPNLISKGHQEYPGSLSSACTSLSSIAGLTGVPAPQSVISGSHTRYTQQTLIKMLLHRRASSPISPNPCFYPPHAPPPSESTHISTHYTIHILPLRQSIDIHIIAPKIHLSLYLSVFAPIDLLSPLILFFHFISPLQCQFTDLLFL